MAATIAAASVAQIASVAVTAASVAGSIQQYMQAGVNAKAQEQAARESNKASIEQMTANYGELSEIEKEAHQKSLEDSMSTQADYMRERGRINTTAAYIGIAGQSLDTQMQDLSKQKFNNYNAIMLTRQSTMDDVADQAESMKQQAKGSLQATTVARPSWAAAALDIGTSLGQGYLGYSALGEQSALAGKATKAASTTKKPFTGSFSSGG